jgi:hypothetical protein
VIVVVAELLTAPLLSVTVRLNTRDVATVGAVNVGVAVYYHCGTTVIVTESGELTWPRLSVTVKLNIRVVACAGAVKIGDAVVAAFRPTVGPNVCVHAYDTILAPFVVA